MERWWNRDAPGEGWRLEIDPEAGIVTESRREHLWLAPLRGLGDLLSDLRYRRLSTADAIFLVIVIAALVRGG